MYDMGNKQEMRLFGRPKASHMKAVRKAAFHKDNFFRVAMDGKSLLDQETLNVLVKEFPPGLLEESDIFLAFAECIANAALHGEAKAMGIFARQRRKILVLSFFQMPPMPCFIAAVLSLARTGILPDYNCDLPGGLGFPILLRLARRVTITDDRTRLQLWFRLK